MLPVVLLAFTHKKWHKSSSEGRTDEASIKKETKKAQKMRNLQWFEIYSVRIHLTSLGALQDLVLLLAIPSVLFLAIPSIWL